jgi:hypothetical protein
MHQKHNTYNHHTLSDLHSHFRTHYGHDAQFRRPSSAHGRPSHTNHHGPENSKVWGYVVGRFVGRVPHHGSAPHADFQIDVEYGGSTIPMYVNVNVESRDNSYDWVLATKPARVQGDNPPPQHMAHAFSDSTPAPPALSYGDASLDFNSFSQMPPTDMVSLIHETVEAADTIVIWGQIYVDKDKRDGHLIAGIHDVHANWDDREIPNSIRNQRDGGIKLYQQSDDGGLMESWLYIMFQTQKDELEEA